MYSFVRQPSRSGSRLSLDGLCYVLAFLALAGCERSSAPSDATASQPKPEYREAVAAARKLGIVARADQGGEVTYLDFYAVRDVPEAIEYVKKFPNLKLLNFSSTNLSDAEMEHLAGAVKLEELGLHGTQVTDAGLVHLADLENLKVLNLNDTQVGDTGLAHLASLKNLEQLRLQSTQVSDAGIPQIAPLENLVVVWLSGSRVTADGVERLREALPEADVVNDEVSDRTSGPLLPASAFPQE